MQESSIAPQYLVTVPSSRERFPPSPGPSTLAGSSTVNTPAQLVLSWEESPPDYMTACSSHHHGQLSMPGRRWPVRAAAAVYLSVGRVPSNEAQTWELEYEGVVR